ncbi:MAG: hypothetical protein H7A43_06870 [Verrucomicrobia bacterium]|nr:hypothetical protein [Kiritimatiellia bacterium]MCP5488355.1 hypothetical protein [Verrucomicrobiota bacterium]
MKKTGQWIILMSLMTGMAMAGENRLGIGAHYWKTVDNVDVQDIQEDGLAYVLTYQRLLGDLFRLGLELEYYPDEFVGSTDAAYSPQAILTAGGGLYAGLGVGMGYYEDGWADEPYFLLRGGLEIELLPGIYGDIHLNYRAETFDDVTNANEEIDTDVLTVGVAVRFDY